MPGIVYLIPSPLHDDGIDAVPAYVTSAIADCQVFFVENERTTRRYFKKLWRARLPGEEIIIDNYEWFVIGSDTEDFKKKLQEGKNIGIISEAGCPGIADPGQLLVQVAQNMGAVIKPLSGPSSIFLALMASGMNGQQFQFAGYLPIENMERNKAIRDLEAESKKKSCSQIFIETPYRNNQMLESLLNYCHSSTRLCLAVNITGKDEWIRTKTIAAWGKETPDLHKQLVIFILHSA
jgi:16S rRNA (cytidine1402-2'-O)-methyltransferase